MANLTEQPPVLLNATNVANSSSAETSWFTRDEVEHFLVQPDVLHALALALGIVATLWGEKLKHVLAVVSSISLGLWLGLVVQDRQRFDEPVFGDVDLPKGVWVPIVAGLLAGAAAMALTYLAWQAALVLLNAGVLTLMTLAFCRLINVSPERIFQVGASLLSAYRMVGAMALVVSLFIGAILVKRFHKSMASFTSALLGTLLLLSGVSHFIQKLGSEAPFSLLDDLARMVAEVRGGRCRLWEQTEDAGHMEQCDCSERCQLEISAWLAGSFTVIAARFVKHHFCKEDDEYKKQKDEERLPLSSGSADNNTPHSLTPSGPSSPRSMKIAPQTIGHRL